MCIRDRVRRADVIFVLQDGVISERGTHDELMVWNGLYARLFAKQFRVDAGEPHRVVNFPAPNAR